MASETPLIVSPLRSAAQAGLVLGGYISLTYYLWMFSPSYPLLIFLFVLGLLGTPFVAFRLMRRYRERLPRQLPFRFPIAWAYGTQTFVFAGIILLLPSYYYFVDILPGQLPHIEQMLAEVYRQNPSVQPLFRDLYGGEPMDMIYKWLQNTSVWAYLWSNFSTTVTLGAALSVVNALILRRDAERI